MAEENVKHTVYEGTLEEINSKLAEQATVVAPEKPTEPEKPVEPAKPAEPVVPQAWDKVKWVNEQFGQQLAKEEEADTFFETLKQRHSQFDELSTASERLRLENEELKAGVDPMQFFANDKVFVYNEMLKKFPDYDPGIVSQIAFSDISEMTPMQVLTYRALLNDPKHEVYDNDQEAADDIETQWVDKGYDPEKPFSEQEPKVKTALKRARKEATDEFNKLKAEIKIPEKVDLVKAKTEKEKALKEKYDRLNPMVKNDLKRVEDSLKTLEFFEKGEDGKQTPIYSFDLANFAESTKVKKALGEATEFLSKTASEWNKDSADKAKGIITESLMKDYLWEHRDQVIASALKAEKAKWVKEEHEKNHNPASANTAQRPQGDDEVQKTLSKARNDFDEMLGKRK